MSDRRRPVQPADVLLVEDNPGDVRLTKEAFKDGQIENDLHVVTDGNEALDFLFRRDEYEDAPRPDLVLLDLDLPRKNGDVVLEEIRADENLEHLPVIVLTTSTAHEDIVRTYDLAANAYLTKPVDADEFIDTVRRLERFWLSVVQLPEDD